MVTQALENRSSVQIAWRSPWAGVRFFSLSDGTRSWVIFSAWPPICFMETRPIPFLWQASRALFRAESLSSQGLNLSMIASTNPPSAAFWICSAIFSSWVEKPTNLTLPVFLIASIVSFISWLLGQSTCWESEAVEEQEVDVVGPQPGEPLVDLLQHVGGLAHAALGGQEDVLADLGHGLEPVVEDDLGVGVPLGGVEVADALAIGVPQEPFERRRLADGPLVEEGDLDAGLAQTPRGQDRLVLARLLLIGAPPRRSPRQARRHGRRRRPGLEEFPTIHPDP